MDKPRRSHRRRWISRCSHGRPLRSGIGRCEGQGGRTTCPRDDKAEQRADLGGDFVSLSWIFLRGGGRSAAVRRRMSSSGGKWGGGHSGGPGWTNMSYFWRKCWSPAFIWKQHPNTKNCRVSLTRFEQQNQNRPRTPSFKLHCCREQLDKTGRLVRFLAWSVS
jgi:hypothetical protein